MNDIRTLALRVAVFKTLMDRISEVDKATRTELLDTLQSMGAEKVSASLPDGTRVAAVSVAGGAGKAKARVTDPAAFLAWVKENRPDEIEERVRDSYRKALLDELARNFEEIPGVELADATVYLTCRPAKDGKDAVAAAWQSGALSLPEVLALPSGGDE